jgi:hypothetical protein
MICLHFSGHFDAMQGSELCGLISEKINNIQPGFKVLTDLSRLKTMDVEAYKSIDMIMDICNKKSVSQVIRVVSEDTPDIGFNIMSLFHYSSDVNIHTFSSIDQANKYLNKNNFQEEIHGIT